MIKMHDSKRSSLLLIPNIFKQIRVQAILYSAFSWGLTCLDTEQLIQQWALRNQCRAFLFPVCYREPSSCTHLFQGAQSDCSVQLLDAEPFCSIETWGFSCTTLGYLFPFHCHIKELEASGQSG